MDSSDNPTPLLPKKKRVGWDHSSAPPSPPQGPRTSTHAPGEPDAIELTRALQILVTDAEEGDVAAAAAALTAAAGPSSNTTSPPSEEKKTATDQNTLSPVALKKPARPALRRNTSYHSRNNSDDEADVVISGTLTPRIQQGNEAAAGARARADYLAASISRRNSTSGDSDDEDVPVRLTVPRPALTASSQQNQQTQSAPRNPQPHQSTRAPAPTSAPAVSSGLGIMDSSSRNQSSLSLGGQSLGDLALDDPEYARIQNLKVSHREAENLVRSHSRKGIFDYRRRHGASSSSGTHAPYPPDQATEEYVAASHKVHAGILGTLLKLYNEAGPGSSVASSEPNTPVASPTPSRRSSFASSTRPSRPTSGIFGNLYSKHGGSNATLTDLMRSANMFGSIGGGLGMSEKLHEAGGPAPTKRSKRAKEQFKITLHLAAVLHRQKYIVTLCQSLMLYGAPTHRLESYLVNTAKVLEIDASFLYLPGYMLISFNDPLTHTSETTLLRVAPALDFGKLKDVHEIYKSVAHDKMSANDGLVHLSAIIKRPKKFNNWVIFFWYCMASMSVGTWGFNARWIDLPVLFGLGGVLGFLVLYVVPRNVHMMPIVEIVAAMITSFLSRMLGSVAGGGLFCFSALAQSAIALILPGYLVLSAALELQSGQMIAGSVRMVYALIYTLFLGFGITIGSVIWGAIYPDATSDTTCSGEALHWAWGLLFVPLFTISLAVINQAKFRQMPVMVIISTLGWMVNRFAGVYFGNSQISSMFGALTVGLLANGYARVVHSWLKHAERYYQPVLCWIKARDPRRRGVDADHERFAAECEQSPGSTAPATPMSEMGPDGQQQGSSYGYGLAAASMLPAIFVQVPSGLAISGSLVSGIELADQINSGKAQATSASAPNIGPAFTVMLGVIQVAVGVSLGLFIATLLVYSIPHKRPKRGGVFTL